jgi:hypothetical protein
MLDVVVDFVVLDSCGVVVSILRVESLELTSKI